jgi:predicted dehydrogenase
MNGSKRTYVFFTEKWNELQVGRPGGAGLEKVTIPEEFWKWPGAPRDPLEGDPLVSFRYDQNFEFVDAILNQRPCVPSFREGAMAQAVMEAAVESAQQKRKVELATRLGRLNERRILRDG